jgi:hypothetical protein
MIRRRSGSGLHRLLQPTATCTHRIVAGAIGERVAVLGQVVLA